MGDQDRKVNTLLATGRRNNPERVQRTVFNAHAAAVAEVTIDHWVTHIGARDGLEFTNPYAGLADDFMPGNAGLMIHHCLAYLRQNCA